MRFITEFELNPPAISAKVDSYKARSEFEMGQMIAESFGWKYIACCKFDNGPVKLKHTLEIEAFPMDKWIEIKQKMFSKFIDDDYEGAAAMLEFIKELESFGKPEGAEKQNNNA